MIDWWYYVHIEGLNLIPSLKITWVQCFLENHPKKYLNLAVCPGILQIYSWKYKNILK